MGSGRSGLDYEEGLTFLEQMMTLFRRKTKRRKVSRIAARGQAKRRTPPNPLSSPPSLSLDRNAPSASVDLEECKGSKGKARTHEEVAEDSAGGEQKKVEPNKKGRKRERGSDEEMDSVVVVGRRGRKYWKKELTKD